MDWKTLSAYIAGKVSCQRRSEITFNGLTEIIH
jgi:hypothetical protein